MEKNAWLPSSESGRYLSVLIQEKYRINLADLIRRNLTELHRETESSNFAFALYQLGLISSSQLQECTNIGENLTRNQFLYDVILTKLISVEQFIVALEIGRNEEILNTLISSVSTFQYHLKDHGNFSTIDGSHSKTIKEQELKRLKCPEVTDCEDTRTRGNRCMEHRQKIKTISFLGIFIFTVILTLIIAFQFIYPTSAKKSGNEIDNTTATTNQNDAELGKVNMTKNVPDYTYSVVYADPIIVRLQINSAQSALPTSLVSTSKYLPIHLKITTTVNYDWSQWSPSRPQQIEILTLEGCFSGAGIHHLLHTLTNLTTLNLSNSDSPCHCDAFTDHESANLAQETVHERLEHLFISGMSELKSKSDECDLLYSFLASQIYLPGLTHALFENIFVTPQNTLFLDAFFMTHKLSLERITFLHVGLVKGCELFGGEEIVFPYLDKASVDFVSSCWDSPDAGRTITNLSKASRLLSEFSSNVSCDSVDVNILKSYWPHLRYYRSKLCQNV